jgi:uncharacterized protein
MPVSPTYPGVYIQEDQSPVHTITPVSTSTTAFVGRTLRGPVNEPTICNSFGDFVQIFGGLWLDNSLGYAVSDFFLNGGSKAVIVRAYNAVQADLTKATADAKTKADAATAAADAADAATAAADAATAAAKADTTKKAAADTAAADAKTKADAATAAAKAAADALAVVAALGKASLALAADKKGPGNVALTLRAKWPGAWGNKLKARITFPDPKASITGQLAKKYGVEINDLFNLTITDSDTNATEEFDNLTVKPGATRAIDKVIAAESDLVEFVGTLPTPPTPPTTPTLRPVDFTNDTKGSDGDTLDSNAVLGDPAAKTGIYALEHADIFNLLCIPPYNTGDVDPDAVLTKAAAYCEQRRAMLLVDPPAAWKKDDATKGTPLFSPSPNAAIYFPRLQEPNPLRENRVETFVPCGAVAGVMARTDLQRGVWKAPAGLEAGLKGVVKPSLPLTDAENGELNPLGINCLRTLPAAGNVVWGARTMVGDDRLASQWKYVPVRRTALFIEETLYRNTKWAVFEPNDEPLWSQLRLNIGVFMHDLFRQGAFQGQSPQDAYFVKCDTTTTTQSDRDRGIVNVIVGFAPLKPTEFVILHIQQITGQLEV